MFLTETLFPNNKSSEIGFSVIPTPFGVIRKSDGKFEAVFQLVLNIGLAPFTLKLSDNFRLVYVDSLKIWRVLRISTSSLERLGGRLR